MKKNIITLTTNNIIIMICDSLVKLIILIIFIMLFINRNTDALCICFIFAIPASTMLRVLKNISLDLMFEKDDKIYLKTRGTRMLRLIDVEENKPLLKGDTLEWLIDGVKYRTEIPTTLMNTFEQKNK